MTNAASRQYAAALVRVIFGVMTLAHGLLKVFVFTIPCTVGVVESLGFPGALAYLVIAAEIGGSLAMVACPLDVEALLGEA